MPRALKLIFLLFLIFIGAKNLKGYITLIEQSIYLNELLPKNFLSKFQLFELIVISFVVII